MEELFIKNKESVINFYVKRLGYFSRFIGLMFKRKSSPILLFDFGKDVNLSIHSFFVFFPFLIIWLDSKNNILDYSMVNPFLAKVFPKNKIKFNKFIEIPINRENKKLIDKIIN